MPLEAGVKGRADTTAAILALEEIMKEETSGDKTLTVEELRNKLNRQYSRLFGNTKEISKKAVGTMLQKLEDFYTYSDQNGNVRSRIRYTGAEKENGSIYKTDYFYEEPEQTEFEKNKKLIRSVIRAEQHFQQSMVETLTFWYNGYDADGNFKAIYNTQVTVIPLRIVETGGRSYLASISPDKKSAKVYHWRIDRMTGLKTGRLDFTGALRDNTIEGYKRTCEEDYLATHPFMFYETEQNRPTTFFLRVINVRKEESALNFLFDAFGRDGVKSQKYLRDHKVIELTVRCVPDALKLFLEQNMFRMEFPKQSGQRAEEARRRILHAIREEYEGFMGRNDEENHYDR